MDTVDVVWWSYTVYIVAVALFMIYFATRITKKGG